MAHSPWSPPDSPACKGLIQHPWTAKKRFLGFSRDSPYVIRAGPSLLCLRDCESKHNWNGNRVSKLNYGPIFVTVRKSLLLPWINPAWITIHLNTTLLVLPSSPVILNLAEALPDQCVLGTLMVAF